MMASDIQAAWQEREERRSRTKSECHPCVQQRSRDELREKSSLRGQRKSKQRNRRKMAGVVSGRPGDGRRKGQPNALREMSDTGEKCPLDSGTCESRPLHTLFRGCGKYGRRRAVSREAAGDRAYFCVFVFKMAREILPTFCGARTVHE